MIRDFDSGYMDFNVQRDYPAAAQDEPSMDGVQLAAGPSPVVSDAGAAFGVYPGMGKRSQKSTIGERMITGAPDFGAGALREGTAAALGFGGDMQKIGRFIGALATDNEGGTFMDKVNRAGKTMQDPTFLPSSEEVSKEGFTIPGTDIKIQLPPAVPPGTSALGLTPEERQAAAEAGGTVGELVGDPLLLAKGGTMAVKGAMAAGKALAPEAGKMAIKSMEMLGSPVQMNIVPPGPNLVSTRLPTAVKKTEDPLTSRLVIDLQAAKKDPEAFAHNMGLIRQYPNFASKARNPDKQAEDFITEVQNNLLYLHDKVPESTRQRSKLWYDGARNIADRFSADYGVPDQAVSGVLAVLSPQKDWFMNVSLGQRVLDIATKQKSTRWDSSMDAVAKTLFTDPKHAPILKSIRGKTLDEVKQPAAKAMWLRTYDQTNNPREHQIISPEGDFIGVRMNQDGKSPTQTGWGSLNEIGKAIVILEDPRIDTISINLGDAHKVRNFYSNIYAPNDPAGPVTIDTHAVAAGLLRPLSGNSREVKHNFGSNVKGEVGPANSSITGVQGTYGIYAEAYRRAAEQRGILPREMQSITWEAVRGLYPETFKSQAKNVEQIDSIWLQYRKGKMSLQEARDEVFRVRSIDPPEWERAGLRSGSPQGVQPAGDTGELSGASVPGGGAGGSGRNDLAATNSSSVKRGRAAPKPGAQ